MSGLGRDPPADWGVSLWRALNPPSPPSERLSGAMETDVAVVGAGVSGLSLAYHLGQSGTEAVVLEAAQQPIGATAASAGVVAPQLVRTTPNAVIRRLGPQKGGRYLLGLAEAGRYTFGLVTGEAIACGAQAAGFINPVPGRDGEAMVRSLISEWRPFRQDLIYADRAETRRLTGCEGYAASLIDPSGGGLDPVAYTDGLAAAIPPARVRIFRDSPVLSLAKTGGRWRLTTADGHLTARSVVLCANGGNAQLHPALTRTVLPLPVVEVATEPLPAALRAEILPEGHALTDSSADVFSIRFDADGRLITASAAAQSLDYAELTALIHGRLSSFIPAMTPTPLAFAWRGTAWLNSSLLPRVVMVEEGLLAVQACNGRGLALNTLVGRDVARWLASQGACETFVPFEKPRQVFGYALARHIPALLMNVSTLIKSVQRAPADQPGR